MQKAYWIDKNIGCKDSNRDEDGTGSVGEVHHSPIDRIQFQSPAKKNSLCCMLL